MRFWQTGCALGCVRCPPKQLGARVLVVVRIFVRCGCALWLCAVLLHNRIAQPHLLMCSVLHKVRPEVAQRFLCGIRSFQVMRFWQKGCALGCVRCPPKQLCTRVLVVVRMVVCCGCALNL